MCRWAPINMNFIAFDTWTSLPLNPNTQKNQKFNIVEWTFMLLFFTKIKPL
jgi:hypothetical protein